MLINTQKQTAMQPSHPQHSLGVQIGENQTRHLEHGDQQRTLRHGAQMVFHQFRNRMQHRRIGGLAEVPEGDGAGQRQLLAGENELGGPDQADEVEPEHVAQPVRLVVFDEAESCWGGWGKNTRKSE